jgi:superfamily II DNA or RNA helicase
MFITIDTHLRVQDTRPDLMDVIKKELTIKNPEYERKRAMGLNRWACGSEYIKLWEKRNGELVLPRGYWARLYELAGKNRNHVLCDERLRFERIQYPKSPQLRDYQEPAVKCARAWQQGITNMPCGGGKTHVGMAIAADLEQPTLWITHTMDLLKQSMDRAIEVLGLTGDMVGLIQGENFKIGTHMSFATVQTLAKRDLSRIRDKFGCIIVDEAHLVFKDDKKARMFERVISQFPAFYRFGLTASDHRSDGLIETMYCILGPKIYEVSQDDPRLMTVTPEMRFIETEFEYSQGIDENGEKEMLSVQQMFRAMREDPQRNLILKGLLKNIKHADSCLVLGDSLEHLEELRNFVQEQTGIPAAFVCGTTKKKEREKIMADMRAGRYQVLFATYALAKLGLDIPRLNVLIMVTPKRDKTTVQQAVGRLMRPFPGKPTPVVYDLWDVKVPQLKYWARDRKRVYKQLGCKVEGGPRVLKW